MSKNKKIGIAVAAAIGLLIAIVAIARSDEVDRDAVLRCGDMVQHISGYGQSATDRFVEAMAPPKDDSGKWYISVVGSSRSRTCERLKDDWSRDANLLAIANPGDPSRSWAHWHYYTPVSNVNSGDVVVQGELVGFANLDIPAGRPGSLKVEGVFDLPKKAEVLAVGVKVYWDADGDPVGGTAGSGAMTATATDNIYIGKMVAAATDTDVLGRVRFDQ